MDAMTKPKRPQKPLPADEALLIAAWHSKDTSMVIATSLGLTESDIRYAWHKLKGEGKLPPLPRRQHQAKPEPSDHHDGRPGDSGDMLAMLIEHHGHDNPDGLRTDFYKGYKPRRS